MTKPVTSLTIHIDDDGACSLAAPSWSDEGHLWAIERRPISLRTVVEVAALLGADASAGVAARITANRERLQRRVDAAEAAERRVREAREALLRLDAVTERP